MERGEQSTHKRNRQHVLIISLVEEKIRTAVGVVLGRIKFQNIQGMQPDELLIHHDTFIENSNCLKQSQTIIQIGSHWNTYFSLLLRVPGTNTVVASACLQEQNLAWPCPQCQNLNF